MNEFLETFVYDLKQLLAKFAKFHIRYLFSGEGIVGIIFAVALAAIFIMRRLRAYAPNIPLEQVDSAVLQVGDILLAAVVFVSVFYLFAISIPKLVWIGEKVEEIVKKLRIWADPEKKKKNDDQVSRLANPAEAEHLGSNPDLVLISHEEIERGVDKALE